MKITQDNGQQIDVTQIHDLWHIGQYLMDQEHGVMKNAGQAIIDTWTEAHEMQREVRRLRDRLNLDENGVELTPNEG